MSLKKIYLSNHRLTPAKAFGSVSQYLDGTIIGNEFIDRSGNGYNVDIINNDIQTGSGFPYKSASLIAQKTSNFGLIPNPNNFWFNGSGVPNQIPVVSFFQNIDYGNQIFSNHASQILDANNVEVFEPRIMEIITYANVLTGSNLTLANNYFAVPVEILSSVIWVDGVNGLDTNPGTKLLPYKSLTKAAVATSNTTIYIKTAAYADTASIVLLNNQVWYFIGYCPCTNTVTPAFETVGTTGSYIQGAIITPPSGGRSVFYISGNNNTIYRCKLNINGAGSKNFQILAGTGNLIKYSILPNSTDTPTIDIRAVGMDIYGCYFSGTQSGVAEIISCNTTTITGNVNIFYNKIVSTLANSHGVFLFNVPGNYYIKYNIIKTTGGDSLQSLLAGSGMTGIIQYMYNRITPTTMAGGIIRSVSATNVINYTITNNNFIVDNSNPISNGIISIIGQPPPVINYNYIDYNVQVGAISISATSAKGAADISYNTILNRADGAVITLGSDVNNTFDNCYNGSTIIGNKIYGIWYFNPNSVTNLSHGIAVFNCIDVKVKYNYANGTNHLVVYKASDRSVATPNTDAICSYNIGVNNDGAIFIKTMSGVQIYNNTTYCNNNNIAIAISGGIYLLGSTGTTDNTIIKNNLFIDATNNNSLISIIRIDPTGSQTGLICNNNVFYSVNGNFIAKVLNPGTINYNFTGWQALGYDINSLNQIVTLNSIINEQFWPKSILSNGANLGSPYNVGLNIATDWALVEIGTPNIITKNQPIPYQNGAYIQ